MEENYQKGQTQKSKQQGYQALKKRKQREKSEAMQLGTYQKPFIKEAKEELKNIYDFNLAGLLANPKFNGSFDSVQLHQLKRFIDNHKPKVSDILNQVGSKEQELIDIKEKAQRLGNQQIPLLHQSLLTPQTTSERQKLIKCKIDENLFLFLEYMDNQFQPSQDFLEIILEMYESFDPDTQTKLFIRVCALNKGEKLPINKQMVEAAMEFLTISRVDNLAAFGLLRLVFQNDISFSDFSLDLLQEFQQQYDQSILNFFKIIPQLKYQVRELLPATCFCFTSPMFKSLKEGGDILHTQIPYQFLPYIIEIISYSFTEGEEAFTKFLEVFKLGCKMHSEFLFKTDFASLLHSIKDKTKTRSPQFFMKLEYSTQVLKIAFDLIQQRKVENFDEDTISSLLSSSQEQYQQLMQRPKVIKESSHNVNKQILESIIDNNKAINLTLIENELSLSAEEQHIFKLMKISKLLYVQQICFKYCVQQNLKGGHYIQFDTGQGKTSLCLAVASALVQNNKKVFIANKSEDLTFRDFKKANIIAKGLNLTVAFINTNDFSGIEAADIIFITAKSLLQYAAVDNNKRVLDNCSCLVDEFDSIFFEKSDWSLNFAKVLTRLQLVIGFSGSILQYYHKQFLENQMKSKFITFSLADHLQIKPQIDQQLAFQTLKQFKEQLLTMCATQIKLTPVIIILKDNFKLIQTCLIRAGISVQALNEKDSQSIEGSLQTFNEKQIGQYQVYLLNETQGRGLDFASTSEIEQNGGVYLIIACIPSCYLQFRQFIGRTGRIGCKGKYSIVLFDKESKNQSGEIFLTRGLTQLQNNDLLFVTKLKVANDTNISFRSLLDSNQTVQIGCGGVQQNNKDSEILDETQNSVEESDMTVEAQLLGEKVRKLLENQYKKQFKDNNRRLQKEQQKLDKKESKELNQQQENIVQNDVLSQKQEQSATTNVNKEYKQEECKTCDNFACNCDKQKKQSNEEVPKQVQNTTLGSLEVNNSVQSDKNDQVNNMPAINLGKRKTEASKKTETKKERTVVQKDAGKQAIIEEVNAAYYLNYALPKSQKEMLDDEVRLTAYKQAIYATCKGKIVLDLGCGTGILSLYALEAGATRVIGVDNANVRGLLNNDLEKFSGKFQFINDTIENLAKYPSKIGKIDVIVSEWMGYFLLYENMIDSYILCIKTFLQPNGIMIPSAAKMFLQAANLDMKADIPIQYKDKNAPFKLVMNDQCIKWQDIISTSCSFKEFDFTKKSITNPLKNGFVQDFSLKAQVSGDFNALVGHFEVKLSEGNFLNTSPEMLQTHWKQSIFFLNNPIAVEYDDFVKGKIHIGAARNNHRNIIVKIAYAVNKGRESSQEIYAFE